MTNDGTTFWIWNTERNAWWAPECHGYTNKIEEAGIYSEEKAREICDQANRHSDSPQDLMVPTTCRVSR